MPHHFRSFSRFFEFTTLTAVSVLGINISSSQLALSQTDDKLAPLIVSESAKLIPDQYIVVLKDEVDASRLKPLIANLEERGARILQVYTSALVGFSFIAPENAEAAKSSMDQLRAMPEVAYIEADTVGEYHIIQPPNPPGAPPAGIDRIDRRLNPLDTTFTYSETGAGVNVYVIDSGMRITHTEFSGRATNGFTVAGTDFSDCAPHGTHVAGTIGGETFGVAKDANLINVRIGGAGDCAPTASNQIAGINWVTANRTLPAVANMSVGGPQSNAVNSAVANSIAAGVTYAISAGNNNADACNQSPASTPLAITVGSTVPATDDRSNFSNFGPCLDIFAPGTNILSAWNTSDTATNTISGTSMAAPHVAGVAALYLSENPAVTPAQVLNRMLFAANTSTTPSWPGIANRGAGSPNILLHWGSLNDGFTDGDPHILTMDGKAYDFQAAGEFVALRDGNVFEVQTRQKAVATLQGVPNEHTGLKTCVSINTAAAIKAGTNRITLQQDKNELIVRIDGKQTSVPPDGLFLNGGAHIIPLPGNGIQVNSPDGSRVSLVPNFWDWQQVWYMNVSILRSRGSEGIMGDIANGSWLPLLPDGSSLGPKPTNSAQRYADLYGKFADSWRVTSANSLFDYRTGESTDDFQDRNWPGETADCKSTTLPSPNPIELGIAKEVCQPVKRRLSRANCIADVLATGDVGFAKSYIATEQIREGQTKISLHIHERSIRDAEKFAVSARVMQLQNSRNTRRISGSLQLFVDGKPSGEPVRVNAKGSAIFYLPKSQRNAKIQVGFVASKRSKLVSSMSE